MAVGQYESASAFAKDLTGGQKFMKFVILGLNILYLIFGIVLCALGAAALSGYAASIAGASLPTGLIVIGAFLIVTAIIGGLSAWFEVRVGLAFYFGAMLLWTIILLAIGIAVLAAKSNLTTYLAKGWAYADCGTQETIQTNFNCCGRYSNGDHYSFNDPGWNKNTDYLMLFTNPNDADAIRNDKAMFATFPSEFCTGKSRGCPGRYTGKFLGDADAGDQCVAGALTFETAGPGRANCSTEAEGCVYALQDSLESNWQAAGGAGIAFAVLMTVGLGFTIMLIKGIGTKTQNAAIERNRAKTQRDLEDKRRRGKGGMRLPDNVL